jgi:hypothetical protein
MEGFKAHDAERESQHCRFFIKCAARKHKCAARQVGLRGHGAPVVEAVESAGSAIAGSSRDKVSVEAFKCEIDHFVSEEIFVDYIAQFTG